MKKKLSKIFGISLAMVLLASLTLVAVPVAAATAISGLTVSVTPVTISTGADYTITFDATTAVPVTAVGAPYDISIALPLGTTVPATGAWGAADITLQSTAGFGVPNTPAVNIPNANITVTAATSTAGPIINIDLAGIGGIQPIGEAAVVRIKTLNTKVVNPAAIADYTLTVKTATDTTAVTSNSYTTAAPTIPSVPGIVMGYNSADVKLYEDTGINAISGAIGTTGVTRVEVGPGTYDEDATITINAAITVVSTDGAAVTIIKDAETPPSGAGGDVNITVAGVTFDGFTVKGNATTASVTVGANNTTIQNCVLSGTGANPALDINAGTATLPTVSSGNTINVATGGIGIDVADTMVAKSTGDAITATGTGKGIVNAGTLTLTGVTVSGASGIGLQNDDTDETVTITGTTFSGLDTALVINNGTVDIKASTITGCGNATAPGKPAIDVAAAVKVTIINNTIADCVDEILQVTANSDKVFLNYNAINNPTKGIDNNENAAVTLDATNNLWDGGGAPPVTMAPFSATAGKIDVEPYLFAAVSTPAMSIGSDTLTAKTTAGVNVVATKSGAAPVTNPVSIAAATYAANPGGTAAVPGVATAYYDVYVNSTGSDADTYTISLFGTVDVNTKVYVWGAGLGEWVLCVPQSVNVFAGSVTVTVTATSTPTITDLVGLPLAIAQPSTAPPTVAATSLVPAMGADDVSVDPTFAWGAVAGATYEFALAEDLALADAFSVIDFSATADVNALPCRSTLKYSTTYYWRVRAIVGSETGLWTTGLFTTEAEPVEEGGDIVVDVPDITVESPDITVQPAEVDITVEPASPVIPDYLLWVIIAVGAVLVIALIVLIVRTRRTA